MGVERTEKSLSQPFYRDQLTDFYDSLEKNGQKLWLFPQRSTPRACSYSDLPKDDANDPIAIYNLLCDFPISMRKPSRDFDPSPRREEQWEFKEWTNVYLNRARTDSPVTYSQDLCAKYLIENLDYIHEKLSPDARDFFGFTYVTDTGNLKESRWSGRAKDPEKVSGKWQWHQNGKMKISAIYTVAVTLIDPNTGDFRVRPYTGEPAGWQYITNGVFCTTPNHHRGGVASSNLKHHTIRWYIARKIRDKGFSDFGVHKCRGGYRDEKTGELKSNTRFTPEEDKLFVKYRKQSWIYIKELWSLIKEMKKQDQGSKQPSVKSEVNLSP